MAQGMEGDFYAMPVLVEESIYISSFARKILPQTLRNIVVVFLDDFSNYHMLGEQRNV